MNSKCPFCRNGLIPIRGGVSAGGAYEDCPKCRGTGRVPIVCLCGSTKFMDAYREAAKHETLAGRIVLSVGMDLRSDSLPEGMDEDITKVMLDELHKRKIDLADEVLFLNVGGYMGSSTLDELRYATSHPDGKRIRFLVDGPSADIESPAGNADSSMTLRYHADGSASTDRPLIAETQSDDIVEDGK